jgi:non-specific protein-tyrosine kinase
VRLAIAIARTGKRVILVDADLRRSQAALRLGLATNFGLGSVLAGERQLSDTLVDYQVTENPQGGQLLVLPGGAPPPNPSELLSSAEMSQLLSHLETQADVVIIDTPPALAVSDTMALLPEASGIVLVARIDQSTRETVRRAQRLITTAKGSLLGVVATGTRAGPGYDRYAYGYYGADTKRRRWPFGRRQRQLIHLDRENGSAPRAGAEASERPHSEPAHQP